MKVLKLILKEKVPTTAFVFAIVGAVSCCGIIINNNFGPHSLVSAQLPEESGIFALQGLDTNTNGLRASLNQVAVSAITPRGPALTTKPEVLGEMTTNQRAPQLQTSNEDKQQAVDLIKQTVQEILSLNFFSNSNNTNTSLVSTTTAAASTNSSLPVTYVPSYAPSNFAGTTIVAAGELSSNNLSTNNITVGGNLTNNGITHLVGDTSVDGNITAAAFYGDGSHLTGIINGGGNGTSTSQWLTATSTSDIFYNAGNVGIGTTSPSTQLSVSGSSQITGHMALGNLGGVDSQIFGFGGVSQSASNYPTNLNINDYRTGDLSFGAVGVPENLTVYGSFAHTGSSAAFIYGADIVPVLTASSTGPINQFSGAEFLPWNYGSGAVDFLSGVIGGAFNEKSGTVNRAIGLTGYAENDGGGTINNEYGVFASSALNYGTGTIGSAYGVYVDLPHNGSGTVNNNYGLYITDQSGMATTGDNFNIYSAGANAINYFSGKVGIGTTTSAAKLAIAPGVNTELVTNGSFTGSASGWTLGTGWAYGSNKVAHTAGQTGILKQTTIPIVKGKGYTYSVDVSNYTTGEVCGFIGTPSGTWPIGIESAGNSSGTFTAQASGDLEFDPTCNGDDPTAAFDGSLDNISFQELTTGLAVHKADGSLGFLADNQGNARVVNQMAIGNLSGINGGILSDVPYPIVLDTEASSSGSSGITGIQGNVLYSSSFSAPSAAVIGISGEADLSGNNDIGAALAVEGTANNKSNGNVSYMVGLVGTVNTFGSGTTTEMDSGSFNLSNQGSGYVGDAVGVQISGLNNSGGGVVNNAYGLRIGDQAAAINNYAILTGVGTVSFGDKVGIGTDTPTKLLQVGSSVVASGTVARFQNTNGTCDINPTNATLQCSSDQRLKQNITSMGDMLEKVLELNPVYFNWNSEATGTVEHPGFIAQEVEKIFPQLVSTDPETGYKSIGYSNFAPYLVKAIAQQQQEILTLQGGLNGNATTSQLSVYNPNNFSQDSVGQAKILAGQSSVDIHFNQAYIYQPIVVADVINSFVTHAITNITVAGFTIILPSPAVADTTFNWHAFASSAAQLTVSDGSHDSVAIIVPGNSHEDSSGQQPALPESDTIEGASTTTVPVIETDSSTSTASSTIIDTLPINDTATSSDPVTPRGLPGDDGQQ